MTRIEFTDSEVPLIVEMVMKRLQELMKRCSELERALADTPKPPFLAQQRIDELKAKLEESQGQYIAARDDRAHLQEELKKVQKEREEALESARVLRKKNQNLASEADSLRKQLLEERETKAKIIDRETAVARESAEAERKTREEAERQRTHAKGQATKAKRELAALREKLKELEVQSARSGATTWSSVERHLDIALKQFEDDPDKSFNALMRAKTALEARTNDEEK